MSSRRSLAQAVSKVWYAEEILAELASHACLFFWISLIDHIVHRDATRWLGVACMSSFPRSNFEGKFGY